MKLRPARSDEAPALCALAMQSKAHWRYSGDQLAAWRDNLVVTADMIRSFPTYVAEIDAQVAGFFLVVPEAGQCQLEHFWVHPSRIGQGVGRVMLREAAHIAAQEGASFLRIEADPNAEPFYLACGARRAGQVPAPIEGAPARVLPVLVLAVGPSVLG